MTAELQPADLRAADVRPAEQAYAGQGDAGRADKGAAEAAGEHAWERGLAMWHVVFGIVVVGVAAGLWLTAGLPVSRRAAVTALFAAMVGWYLAVGVPALRRGSTRLSAGYLAGAFALFVPAAVMFSPSSFLLFAFCSQCFMLLEMPRAIVAVVAFFAVPAVSSMNQGGWRAGPVLEALGANAFVVGISGVVALWINGIIRQSRERAELIEKLEATRAELAEANRESGVLAERERLAAEIHDTLAQGFTSILMLVQAAESKAERDLAAARRHLELARRTAHENLAEARALVAALAPVHLEAASLTDALRRLVDGIGGELGIRSSFAVDGAPRPLPAGVEVVLLRATQEALANVRKHSGAETVDVRLAYDDCVSRLVISDDGHGFDPGRPPAGFGLHGMRARAEQVGGTLDVRSAPGRGTTLTLEMPA